MRETEKKILNNFRKIIETLWGKIEIIRSWCRYYEEILESSPGNWEKSTNKWKTLKKYGKYLRQILKKTF